MILIIDDEQMILNLAQRILTRDGHASLVAENARIGLELFTQHMAAIDLVLLDYCLPETSGLEVLETMRQKAPNIPCILSSGAHDLSNDLPEHLSKNTHILAKPYRSRELTELVNRIMAGKARLSPTPTT